MDSVLHRNSIVSARPQTVVSISSSSPAHGFLYSGYAGPVAARRHSVVGFGWLYPNQQSVLRVT